MSISIGSCLEMQVEMERAPQLMQERRGDSAADALQRKQVGGAVDALMRGGGVVVFVG